MYSVEPIIIQQLFRQVCLRYFIFIFNHNYLFKIFYIIDAQALRGLLVRSDCCNWSKALQIR